MAIPEPIPNPDPDIWQSKPKLSQYPKDGHGGRMMLDRVLLRHG